MLNSKNNLLTQLHALNLSSDEAKVYLELLRGPSNHLRLSHDTGVNRTKVYRLVALLENRSLISRHTDDRGTFLVAADPATLEVEIVNKEEELKQQRVILRQLVPALTDLQTEDDSFAVRTYEGQPGLKQMCWHELKTKGELLSFGNGTIEELITDDRWAAKHRLHQVAAGYSVREIVNYEEGNPLPSLSADTIFQAGLYNYRVLPHDLLTFDNQMIIYNDTVAVYHWRRGQKVGTEITSPTHTAMMRQLFEHYWQVAARGQTAHT